MYNTLFSSMTVEDLFNEQKNKISNKVDVFTKEEIVANDLKILAENLYQEFYIAIVDIQEESKQEREIKQMNDGGLEFVFHYPFYGEEKLFRCTASTNLLTDFSGIEIGYKELLIKVTLNSERCRFVNEATIIQRVDELLKKITTQINYVNTDIKKLNEKLKLHAWKILNQKKQNAEKYFELAKKLEISVEKNDVYHTCVEIERRIVPIKHEYKKENYYFLNNEDYLGILEVIKHIGSTYERTPKSYEKLNEEDLRNTILASLNAAYKGNATGETFRKKGKTDICIEQENRSAFVAECKMWTGQKEIEDALCQLDSYLTWRDCKTALIYFVKRKDFWKIINKAKDALASIAGMMDVKDIDKNEFQCLFASKSNVGQKIEVRVMLFNLYCE